MRRYRPGGTEVIHARVEHTAAGTGMLEADEMLFPAVRNVARGGGLGIRSLPSGMKLMGLLVISAIFKVQQGDRVKPHVSVVVHGKGESKAAVVDKIVIPFLDAQLAGLYIGAAVDGRSFFA